MHANFEQKYPKTAIVAEGGLFVRNLGKIFLHSTVGLTKSRAFHTEPW